MSRLRFRRRQEFQPEFFAIAIPRGRFCDGGGSPMSLPASGAGLFLV